MLLYFCYLVSILLSALAATWYWKSLKKMQLILFVPYLWYVTLQEWAIFILTKLEIIYKTALFYNIYRPLSATAFFLIFHRLKANNPQTKTLIQQLYIGYVLFAILLLAIVPLTEMNRYLSLATGFVISSYALLFLFSYFNLDDSKEEYKWYPVIPISIGLLAFYPVVNISFTFYSHLLRSEALIFGTKVYQFVPQVMSLFMYSCFTYAFYLCKKRN